MIYSICIKHSYDNTDIEDNYSDTLVNIFRYIESYNPSMPVKTWIYAVAQRYIFDINRRKKSISKSDNVDIEVMEDLVSEDDVGSNVMGVDNYQEHYNDAILSALDKLAPIHKEALLLQQAGYKVDEIVEISYQNGNLKSKNCDTIKSRIFLAKKGMQKLITRDGDAKRE